MDNENADQIPEIPGDEERLRYDLLIYLFERRHRVSKPLIDAVAHFTYEYGQRLLKADPQQEDSNV